MSTNKKTSDARKILHQRYVKDDAQRKAALEAERGNAEVAQMIYDLRTNAGLSQKELAGLIGTTQSVISRLEDADYEGHSLTMLNRIAHALRQKLALVVSTEDPAARTLRYVFRVLVQNLRRAKGLTVDECAQRLGTDREEIIAMERDDAYRPAPVMLRWLSEFYGVPERGLAALGGAVGEMPSEVRESALQYAAQCESSARLTKQEKEALDQFLEFLKAED